MVSLEGVREQVNERRSPTVRRISLNKKRLIVRKNVRPFGIRR